MDWCHACGDFEDEWGECACDDCIQCGRSVRDGWGMQEYACADCGTEIKSLVQCDECLMDFLCGACRKRRDPEASAVKEAP